MFEGTKIVLAHFYWICVIKCANISFIWALDLVFYNKTHWITYILKLMSIQYKLKFTSIFQICLVCLFLFSRKDTDTSVFLAYWYRYLFSIFQIQYCYWYFSISKSYWILNTSTFILYWSGLWLLLFRRWSLHPFLGVFLIESKLFQGSFLSWLSTYLLGK